MSHCLFSSSSKHPRVTCKEGENKERKIALARKDKHLEFCLELMSWEVRAPPLKAARYSRSRSRKLHSFDKPLSAYCVRYRISLLSTSWEAGAKTEQ